MHIWSVLKGLIGTGNQCRVEMDDSKQPDPKQNEIRTYDANLNGFYWKFCGKCRDVSGSTFGGGLWWFSRSFASSFRSI